jgi:hypothetical protein
VHKCSGHHDSNVYEVMLIASSLLAIPIDSSIFNRKKIAVLSKQFFLKCSIVISQMQAQFYTFPPCMVPMVWLWCTYESTPMAAYVLSVIFIPPTWAVRFFSGCGTFSTYSSSSSSYFAPCTSSNHCLHIFLYLHGA